jgi:hypothetical protein
VRNHRLGFEIPYSFRGQAHAYTADFLVELAVPALGSSPGAGDRPGSGEHVVIEVKGMEREQDRAKQVGMQRWVDAVNHWGRLGHWRFEKLHSPHDLDRVL